MMERILDDIRAEREKQDAKWGQQNHPNGTGPEVRPLAFSQDQRAAFLDLMFAPDLAAYFRDKCQANTPDTDNWRDILLEEIFEAIAEADPKDLRTELVQSAAVIVAWIEKLDRESNA